MADVARLAMEFTQTGAKRVQSDMDALRSGSVRLTRATEQQIKAQTRLSSSFVPMSRNIRKAGVAANRASFDMRGISMQLSQVAQQGSATGNYLQALAIQLPDLALAFGPVGIAIGAVVGGLATFALSASNAEQQTADLAEQMRELGKELGYVSERQRDIINTSYAQTIAEQTRKIQEQREAIYDANRNAETFYRNQLRAGVPASVIESSEAWKNLIAPVEEAKNAISGYQQVIDATKKEREEFWKDLDNTGESAEKTAEKIRDMVKAAEQQAAVIGLSARAVATYEAALAGANAEQILAIDQAYQRIEAEQAKQEALKQTEQREAAARKAMLAATQISVEDDPLLQRIAAEKRGQEILLQQQKDYATARESLDQQMVSSAASTVGNLANVVGQLAGKQSNAYRAAFLAQQGFAIASAIVNTQLAAAAALAPPPIGLGPVAGLPYASTIEGLGAANVAIIAGQTIAGLAGTYGGGSGDASTASFLGGGFTGTGSRSGGVDGKGGFPAILHPNETVVDHTRGQSTGGSMIVNVNNAPQGTRVEQRTDNQGNQVADVFIADVANGGPMSKTMQSTFGLRRQGR